jgi:hypothetical protein
VPIDAAPVAPEPAQGERQGNRSGPRSAFRRGVLAAGAGPSRRRTQTRTRRQQYRRFGALCRRRRLSSYCGRLRGDVLNVTAVLCGSRLGRGWVRPGGPMARRRPRGYRRTEAALGALYDSRWAAATARQTLKRFGIRRQEGSRPRRVYTGANARRCVECAADPRTLSSSSTTSFERRGKRLTILMLET